jgi:UDP-sugar transporter A1/2/3
MLIQVMHYSRVMPGYKADSRYYASTAVLLNEIIKLIFCSIVSISQIGLKAAIEETLSSDCWKLSIPAFLYTLQNSLQYVAVSNLDAATFQVTYQLKILTTAFFAVTMLHKELSRLQWMCLVFLTLGIGLVQMPAEAFYGAISAITGASATKKAVKKPAHGADEMNGLVGFVAVSIACVLSGLAGIYFEKVLKGTKKVSLWTRNVQLSMFSLFPALFIGVLAKDGTKIMEHGFFYGYNSVVWSAIMLQAIGGIVVALCVKYADNIAKNFATSISILISFLASVYFFDFKVVPNFVIGALVVIAVTYLYSLAPSPRKVADLEKYSPVQTQDEDNK